MTLSAQPVVAQGTNDNNMPFLSAKVESPEGLPAANPADSLSTRVMPGTLAASAAAMPAMPAPAMPTMLVQPVVLPKPLHKTEWRLSVVALIAAHSADAATSWQKRELNPILSPGNGAFGWQTLAIKGGIAVGSLTLQAFTLRHHPETAKRFAIINFIEAGAIAGVAGHNATIPR